MRKIFISLIRAYQYLISPFLPPSCRFTPSCSSYAVEAIERFGILRGGWMAVRRVTRCHPWHEAGYDPVPEKTAPKAAISHKPLHGPLDETRENEKSSDENDSNKTA